MPRVIPLLQTEEILWSVLKGHWGSKQLTKQLLITHANLIKTPNLDNVLECRLLRELAESQSACPAIHLALSGAQFVRGIATAKEFLIALSLNKPHPKIEDLAKDALQKNQNYFQNNSYCQSFVNKTYGMPQNQSCLVWDGQQDDPNDFQRTLWKKVGTDWWIIEGINRSTAVATAILEGALSPETEFGVYIVL